VVVVVMVVVVIIVVVILTTQRLSYLEFVESRALIRILHTLSIMLYKLIITVHACSPADQLFLQC
jgi:hypothetical protein